MLFHVSFFISSTMMVWLSQLIGRFSRRRRFDIIHSHHYGSPLFCDVITSHYCERQGAVLAAARSDRMPGCTVRERVWSRAWSFIEGRLFSGTRSKPLIVPSKVMKCDFMNHGASLEGTFVVYSGVDPETYSTSNRRLFREEICRLHGLTEDTPLVLFVGGYWWRKGVAQAIEALPFLESHRVQLLIVGSGDVTAYQKLASGLGVGDRVIFAGPRRESWKYYGASDVYLLPSLYEPFGLSVMASGLPVLVSRNAGVSEIIEDGQSGLLLNAPRSVEEIATKLTTLLADETPRRELGDKARETALQYTWERVAERTLQVYRQVVDGERPRSTRIPHCN